jgi:hypothetical protein
MSSMQAQESEVVQGTVVGIIQKGVDKWQVAVQPPGSQYSKNLWTKDEQLVASLSSMIGTQQSFMCGVSHWTNQQGQNVRSLWINGVGPGVQQQPQQPQGNNVPGMQTVGQVMQQPGVVPQQPQQWGQAQQPQQRFETQDEKRISIHRQCASKVAAWLLPSLPPDVPRDFTTFLTLCERIYAYYEHGVASEADNVPFGDDGHPDDGDFPY